jgi:hypothetical protein
VLGEEIVHVVTDAIAQVVAEVSNGVQARQQSGPMILGHGTDNFQRLLEHPHQRGV